MNVYEFGLNVFIATFSIAFGISLTIIFTMFMITWIDNKIIWRKRK